MGSQRSSNRAKKAVRKHKQLQWWSIRVSLDRFANPTSNDYLPIFSDQERLEAVVGPALKTFWTEPNVPKNERTFVDGMFQFEASQVEMKWGDQNLHIQGCLKTRKRVQKPFVIALFNSNFNGTAPYPVFSGSYVRPAVTAEYKNLMAYCMKRTSRLVGPWQCKEGKVYMGEDVITRDMLWGWQRYLLQQIEQYKKDATAKKFGKRDVIFVVDQAGAAGKSSFCKFLSYHKIAGVFGYGSPRDLMYDVINRPPYLCYLFDLTRARPQDSSFADTCSAIENLKNGTIHNLKYKVETRLQWPALVIIFANFLPTEAQKSLLSIDRWVIMEVSPNHIPRNVREQRAADVARRNELIRGFNIGCRCD